MTFVCVHLVLSSSWGLLGPSALDRPWFLGSRKALATTQLALGLVAAVVAFRRPPLWREWLGSAAYLAFGAVAAMAGLFFAIGPAELMLGPTRLWPLSLAAAAFLLAPAVLAGSLLGGFLKRAAGVVSKK